MTDLRQFRTLSRNWEAFGQSDPMFGVLSDPTKFGGKWDPEEFFETGRAHVQHLLGILDTAGIAYDKGTCLDFGCGPGRLTRALSECFAHTIGVDVAKSMIEPARRHLRPGDRCEYVLNRDPDLRQFADGTFDFVHSCLVLQHIPPQVTLSYVREFFRVCKPGGLVVFQVPAATRSEDVITASLVLPDSGYRASFAFLDPPSALEVNQMATLRVVLTNRSDVEWRHDIPAGRHICLANHWLYGDGRTALADDGRAFLPHPLRPGESLTLPLRITAPAQPGVYQIEVDLVQEKVCWFAEKGSETARASVSVERSSATAIPPSVDAVPRVSLVERMRRRFRRGTPTFEMHVVPRGEVEQVIHSSGGTLLRAIDDNAAGERWLSYSYVARRLPGPAPQ